jgi:hypothetical protein
MGYVYTNTHICVHCRVGLRKVDKSCCGRKNKRNDLYVCKRCGKRYILKEGK